MVTVYNDSDRRRELTGLQVVGYNIPRGCVAAYFPEANVLVPIDNYGRDSWTPAYKSVVVKIKSY